MSDNASSQAASTPAEPTAKARSCAVCRQRRVRCDKQQPKCGNCQKADIPCTLPPRDRQPRWAKRLNQMSRTATTGSDLNVNRVMDRVHNLENLVKELRSQLEVAKRNASSNGSSPENSGSQGEVGYENGSVQSQLGRLVLQDTTRSHYVSGGFWSKIDDELDALRMDIQDPGADDSDDSEHGDDQHDQQTGQQNGQAWLFPDSRETSPPDMRELHPLPSQIPFLLEVFCENVNWIMHVTHVPTITHMFREVRSKGTSVLNSNQEALAFAIYYAAVASMEDDEVMTNFGASKVDLTRRFHIGMQNALTKADFLSLPNLTNIQALAIYLLLARRIESPRQVWMLVGLLIRMAIFIGLQRDGSQFETLSPFDIEMRRRTWWLVCVLDLKAAEDQGTEPAIPIGSFDTKIPSNIMDTDISPEIKVMPPERQSVSDMTPLRIQAGVADVSKQMMALSGQEWAAMEDQSRLVNEIYQKFEHEYFRYTTDPNSPVYPSANVVARLVMSKMTLIAFLPVLLSSSSEHLSQEIRTKLLVAAIEVSEYNHQLNAEPTWQRWRWLYQTHTHWYAIVFLMIELGRRPWSPLVERGWAVLHSEWLFPAEARNGKSKTLRIWIPLRRLMAKVRRHRVEEVERLRSDGAERERLWKEDQGVEMPKSPEPCVRSQEQGTFWERWRALFEQREDAAWDGMEAPQASHQLPATSATTTYNTQPLPTTTSSGTNIPNPLVVEQPTTSPPQYDTNNIAGPALQSQPYSVFPSSDWSNSAWPDLDDQAFDDIMNMDLDLGGTGWNEEMNWYSWTQGVRDLETEGWHTAG